jgi:hypothetical protein
MSTESSISVAELEKRLGLFQRLVAAQDKLLVAYRIGGRPSEKTLSEIRDTKDALKIA